MGRGAAPRGRILAAISVHTHCPVLFQPPLGTFSPECSFQKWAVVFSSKSFHSDCVCSHWSLMSHSLPCETVATHPPPMGGPWGDNQVG